jgi:hypothetical protein
VNETLNPFSSWISYCNKDIPVHMKTQNLWAELQARKCTT